MKIRFLGALSALCALGFLCANSRPVAAQAAGPGAGAAQVDPGSSLFRSLPTMGDVGGAPGKSMSPSNPSKAKAGVPVKQTARPGIGVTVIDDPIFEGSERTKSGAKGTEGPGSRSATAKTPKKTTQQDIEGVVQLHYGF
jgi:hypothetical protein